MIWLQGIFAVALLGGAIYGWVLLQRKFRGEDEPSNEKRKRRKKDSDEANELEAFIAAYRDGKIDPTMLADGSDGVAVPPQAVAAPAAPAQTTAPAAARAPAPVAAGSVGAGSVGTAAPFGTAAPVGAATPVGTGTLLRPEVKLGYLLFRTGMRDHHVFPNVRLGDLGYGVAVGTVDLLVCDPAFKYVAAIDIYTGDKPDDIPKSMFLNRAGIRHLQFSSKAIPKPAQLQELIYGKSAT